MQQELPVICLLAKLEPSKVSVVGSAAEAAEAAPPGGSVSIVVNEGLQLLLPLAGLFDVEKELARLAKQKTKVSGVWTTDSNEVVRVTPVSLLAASGLPSIRHPASFTASTCSSIHKIASFDGPYPVQHHSMCQSSSTLRTLIAG